jgi:hypothetical protein
MKLTSLLLAVLFLIPGCVRTTYDVDLTVEGNQLHRVVTEQVRDTQNPEKDTDTVLTDGLFTVMPEDITRLIDTPEGVDRPIDIPGNIDNAGQYIRYESAMGTAQIYIEQFRGNSRPADTLQSAFANIDTGMDAILAELRTTCSDMEQFPKLETFIDDTLRADLKDLCVYFYLLSNTPHATWLGPADNADANAYRPKLSEIYLMRITQFLLNEEYLTPETAPTWARLITEGTENGDDLEWCEDFSEQLFSDILARKAEVTNPELIDALIHIDLGSLRAPEYKYDDEDDTFSDDDSPTITADLITVAAWSYLLFPSGDNEHINAQLTEVATPLLSNGWWDEETQTIHWTRPLPDRSSLPALCYAIWADSNDDFQKEHFGNVILTGEDLFLYCAWKASLTDAEAAEWDAALATCTPGSLRPLKKLNWPDTDYEDKGAEMIENAIDGE